MDQNLVMDFSSNYINCLISDDLDEKDCFIFNNEKREVTKVFNKNYIDIKLKCDEIEFVNKKHYIERRETDIIKKICDEKNLRIFFIVSEIGGIGKTTMANYICTKLKDEKQFIVKTFKADFIFDKYLEILKHEFLYSVDKLKENNFNLVNSLNNEFDKLLNENKELNILFCIDNVGNKNEEQLGKYLSRLHKKIKVLITTRQNNLLQHLEEIEIFGKDFLNKFDKEDAKNYFLKQNEIKKYFNKETTERNIEKLIKNEKFTPLRMELTAKLFIKNIKKCKSSNEIDNVFDNVTNDEEFVEIVLNSLRFENDHIFEFFNYISFLDNNFISIETIQILMSQSREKINDIINLLDENGILQRKRYNQNSGIKIHDIFLFVINKKIKNNFKMFREIENRILVFLYEKAIENDGLKDECVYKMKEYIYHIYKLVEFYDPKSDDSCVNEAFKLFNTIAKYESEFNCNFEKALQIFRKIETKFTNERQKLALTLNNIAFVYKKMEKYEKAIENYQKSFRMYKTINLDQQDHSDLASCLEKIALIYEIIEKPEKALENYQESFRIYKNIYPNQPNHKDIIRCLINIDLVDKKMKRFCELMKCNEKALEKYQEAFNIRKKFYPNKPDRPDLASLLYDIASVLNRMGKYEEAFEKYEESFQMRKKIYLDQPDHPEIAMSLNKMALVYKNMGKYEEALEKYEESFKLRQKFYSNQPDHPDIARSLSNINLVKKKMQIN